MGSLFTTEVKTTVSEPAAEKPSQQDILRLQCAYLAAQGMKQADIAKALGNQLGQSQISRYLKEARNRSELLEKVEWPDNFEESDREAIKRAALPEHDREELLALLNSWRPSRSSPRVRDVHVVYAGEDKDPTRPTTTDTEVFGRNAAPIIAQMFKSTSICAVAWGETIRAIVNAIGPYAEAEPAPQFIPLCGQPLNHHTESAVTSSAAALALTEEFGSKENTRYSLRGVPARIPRGLDKNLSDVAHPQATVNHVMRSFVDTCQHYREIFGGDDPLIAQADMILTSIGDIAGVEHDPLYQDMKDSEDVEDDYLKTITSGNICGTWLPTDPKSEDHVREVQGINDRWLGIKQDQIKECAMTVGVEGLAAPGVVVVAADPMQANIIKLAVGLINTLVISPELAQALLAVGRQEQTRAR